MSQHQNGQYVRHTYNHQNSQFVTHIQSSERPICHTTIKQPIFSKHAKRTFEARYNSHKTTEIVDGKRSKHL